jgi:hypothetical protein
MVCRAAPDTVINSIDGWTAVNWNGEIPFSNEKLWKPGTLQELVEVVARATEKNKELRAFGTRWAFEDIAVSADWAIEMDALDKPLDYVLAANPSVLTPFWQRMLGPQDPLDPFVPRRLVHVEAGIRIAALSELLDARGLSLPVLGGSNGQKLGGAVSTSTHGGEWREPPLPDLIRALHLVTAGGRELWIERETEPLTVGATLPLPCADAEVIRDDEIFKAALVACGRFGVIYSVVLEVVDKFRVVEDICIPRRAEVMRALRDGIVGGGLLFQPLFDMLDQFSPAAPDAAGEPRFFQILMNSQNPEVLWVTRRYVTTIADDVPAPRDPLLVTGETEVDQRNAIVTAANAALTIAAIHAGGNPLGGFAMATYIVGVQTAMNHTITSRPYTLGNVTAAAVTALWQIHANEQVAHLNGFLINQRMKLSGKRGVYHLMTSGTRADSDNEDLKVSSIEVVFDASKDLYLAFLEEVCQAAPRYRQAGYISLRPSRKSEAFLSMHNVRGQFAVSIEFSTLQNLPDNDAWMKYVHDRALIWGGRPHWGQYNKPTPLDVMYMYGDSLNRWREALLRVSGTSMVFSNNFCRLRGLEPTAIVREITSTMQTRDGVITHICNDAMPWSPVPRHVAIDEIQAGVVKYFVRSRGGLVGIHVVGGEYLRTDPNDTLEDNLDNL